MVEENAAMPAENVALKAQIRPPTPHSEVSSSSIRQQVALTPEFMDQQKKEVKEQKTTQPRMKNMV